MRSSDLAIGSSHTLTDNSHVFIEVKSVHIKVENDAVFPVGYKKPKQVTVSERANKHVTELTHMAREGLKTMIVFVVQREDCDTFAPYREKDPVFANLIDEAKKSGVVVKVVYTGVSRKGIYLRHIV